MSTSRRNYGQYNTSSAYDFDMFMPKRKEEKEGKKGKVIKISDTPAQKIRQEQQRRKAASSAVMARVSTVAVSMMIVAMVCAMIYLRIEVTDASRELGELKSQAELLKSEENRLRMELENKMSIANIEEQATALGMQKVDAAQVNYVRVNGGETVESNDNTDAADTADTAGEIQTADSD
ncbi:MAG TPA: cell division protein FtsL [Firmicutes bacterium]|nr:cell division protein FtsL [Bacillota bacterium]